MAGIKKKSSLRDKASKKSQLAKINEFKQELAVDAPAQQDPTYHENPFLKLAKSTKKEKQQVKSDKFVSKLILGDTRISKSALRRRKRKAKEQLKPKLDDLLLNLPDESGADAKHEDTKLFIKKVKRENKPNPTKASGIKQILKQESGMFKTALQNRSTNFASLKDMIQQNLQNNAK
ncbi:Ribosome biogenesis protein SLX9 [Candida viswanathii]|uniref:Ribosome biogenesis protein SLX9 n=1 Tax=Candida viswanathii TaxID=5486 RepID=A0A367XM61_9ASCO|nr:Ribosome biogenesis protein SLX9 [Candida viswanathii]